jgi:hypothetical protein
MQLCMRLALPLAILEVSFLSFAGRHQSLESILLLLLQPLQQ